MFPDAPTERGRKHLKTLITAQTEGYRACILFLIQRSDATLFTPNIETDPKFSQALSDAVLQGVEAYAYHSEFTGNLITLRDKVEVTIPP
jgi:sugar fermentation stimulation protein A